MDIKGHYCDVCGCELKRPARIITTVGKFQIHEDERKYNRLITIPEITITLPKIGGAYADFCAECAKEALSNYIIYDGVKGSTKIVGDD